MALRLGFYYHIPMYLDSDMRLRTPSYLGRFLDSLALHCQTLTCFMHSPRPDEYAQMDYVIQSKNVQLVNIGPHVSVPKRMLESREFSRPIRQYSEALDVILLRGPSPLLPAMAAAAGGLPIVLLLVGDYLAGIDDLPQPRWRKEIIRAWSYWNYRQQMRIAKRSLTFVNSRRLYDQFRPHVPHLLETQTTTLHNADFFYREDTSLRPPYQLLYTGRMDRAKGLFEMVEAVNLLVNKGIDTVLNLVGMVQKDDPILDQIREYAQAHAISNRVLYHGYKTLGPELFAYYRMADIYILASQSHFEGFPRTIWEAMAHSLPVVATKVGSIPHFLKHQETAWLIEGTDGSSIASGILGLIKDATVRKRVIVQARQLAQKNTLENRALQLYTQLTDWLLNNEKD